MLEISRPTLYKYMEYYNEGNDDKIPDEVRGYFDYMSEEDRTRAQSRDYIEKMYLSRKSNNFGSQGLCETANESDVEKLRILNAQNQTIIRSGEGWYEGSLSNLCVPDNGTAMVIFRDAFTGPCVTRLFVFIELDGEEVPIGTYYPEPGMNFVRVDNLIPKLDYMYRLVQSSEGEKIVSPTRTLRLR